MVLDNKNLFIEYLKDRKFPEKNIQEHYYYFTVKVCRINKDFRTDENPYPKMDWSIKTFRFYSIEGFEHYWEEIRTLCKTFRARAYFSVNPKNKRTIVLKVLQRMAACLEQIDFGNPWTIYESEESQNGVSPKLFVIDIDNTGPCSCIVNDIKSIINNNCRPLERIDKVLAVFPTVSGVHLITSAFSKENLAEECLLRNITVPEIQSNGISLLYYNDEG